MLARDRREPAAVLTGRYNKDRKAEGQTSRVVSHRNNKTSMYKHTLTHTHTLTHPHTHTLPSLPPSLVVTPIHTSSAAPGPGVGKYHVGEAEDAMRAKRKALLVGRQKERKASKQPGPAEYNLEQKGVTHNDRRAAAAVLIGRPAEKKSEDALQAQPGPSSYSPPRDLAIGKAAPAFTIGSRRVDHRDATRDTPAPGHYDTVAADAKQRQTAGFAARVTARVQERTADIGPGPGKYDGETAVAARAPAASVVGRPLSPREQRRRRYDRMRQHKKVRFGETTTLGTPAHASERGDGVAVVEDEHGWWLEDGPGPGAYDVSAAASAVAGNRRTTAAVLVGRPKERKADKQPGPSQYNVAAAEAKAWRARGAVSFGKAPEPDADAKRNETAGPGPADYDTAAATAAAAARTGVLILGRPKPPRVEETPGPYFAPTASIGTAGPSFAFTGRTWKDRPVEGPGPGKYSVLDVEEAQRKKKHLASGATIIGRPAEKKPEQVCRMIAPLFLCVCVCSFVFVRVRV